MTEPDMEQMGTIWGGEILLADYEDFTRFGNITPFYRLAEMSLQKKAGGSQYLWIYGYTKDRELAGEIMKKLDLCSEKREQGTVCHGRQEVECSALYQCGTVI